MKQKDEKGYEINIVSIIISVLALLLVFIFATTMPTKTVYVLGNLKSVVTDKLGSLFIVLVIIILAYDVWLILSKYGEIRFGKSKPLYSTFGWIAMIFCATMGASILYWSSVEWMYNVTTPPMNLDSLSREAYEMAMPYSFFHWGFPAWGIYAVGVIPFAYRYYVRCKQGLKLELVCQGVLGTHSEKLLGQIIGIIFIFGTLGGTTLTFGSGLPMIVALLNNLFHVPETFITYICLIGCTTVIFTASAISGIKKGIEVLSKLSFCFCVLILFAIFFLGHGVFIIENTLQSLGKMIAGFVPMLTDLDTIGKSGYPQVWTVFYWAWWIALAPAMWIFITKISSGRRIKDVILAVIVAGTAGSVLFFGIIGNHGIYEQLFNGADILNVFETQGDTQAMIYALTLLPFDKLVLILLMIAGFFLMVTTLDSVAYTLGSSSIKNIKAFEQPPVKFRIFWAVLITIIPISLFYTQADINAFQSITIITSIPIVICIILAMISCTKWLLSDYKHKTRQEIIEEYKIEE